MIFMLGMIVGAMLDTVVLAVRIATLCMVSPKAAKAWDDLVEARREADHE